jgi:hypothetical protein
LIEHASDFFFANRYNEDDNWVKYIRGLKDINQRDEKGNTVL